MLNVVFCSHNTSTPYELIYPFYYNGHYKLVVEKRDEEGVNKYSLTYSLISKNKV